jgi:hypothetical protein
MQNKTVSVLTIYVFFCIFVGIEFFGLFNFKTDRLFFINTYDVMLVSLNFVFFFLLSQTKFIFIIKNTPYLRNFFYFYLMCIFVIISMPLRGAISVIDAARVARDYLVFPLAFLVYYDVLVHNNSKIYIRFFLSLAVITSLIIIVNSFYPWLIQAILTNVRASESYKFYYKRNYLLIGSMLYPHIGCIYILNNMLYGSRIKWGNSLFFLFFMGSALQGLRIYFLLIILFTGYFLFKKVNARKIVKRMILTVACLGIVFFIDYYFLDQQIYGKIDTTLMEIWSGDKGTLRGRYERDQNFMYPMFYEKPLQGWGFIYYGSKYAEKIGYVQANIDRNFSLYSIDSGYLTLLIQFGIIGLIFMSFFLFRIIIGLSKQPSKFNNTASMIWIFLILSLVTHGGFFSSYGLIPVCFFMGLTADSVRRRPLRPFPLVVSNE